MDRDDKLLLRTQTRETRQRQIPKQSILQVKIQRVNQLDAAQLDEEVLSLLWSQLEQVFRLLPVRNPLSTWCPFHLCFFCI